MKQGLFALGMSVVLSIMAELPATTGGLEIGLGGELRPGGSFR